MKRSLPALLATALVFALVPAGCVVIASTGEYRIYRKIRLTDSNLARGQLIRRYERDYPNGALKTKVAAERKHLDETMYEAAVDEYGLQQYLSALPDAEHHDIAEARLKQARQVRTIRDAATRAQNEQDASVAAQADAQRRAWFRGAYSGWLQILARINGWNTPMEEFLNTNGELAAVWREDGIAPVCDANVCTRSYPHDYFIRRRGETRIDRQARFLLRIHMTDGKVTRVDALVAGQGFYAWRELESQEELDATDPTQQAESRELAKVALSQIISDYLAGGNVVEVPAGSPTVLWAYAVPPIRVEVVAAPEGAPGAGPGEGFSIVYAPPVAAPPAPPARRRR